MVAAAEPPKSPSLEEIREALSPAKEAADGPADAAVLVPIYGQGRSLDLLLTRRREDLASHPGQISFPGGRREPSDRDLLETALREAGEEVGIVADDTTALGFLTDLRTHRAEPVATYVAHVAGDPPRSRPPARRSTRSSSSRSRPSWTRPATSPAPPAASGAGTWSITGTSRRGRSGG